MKRGISCVEAVLEVARRIRNLAHIVVIPDYRYKSIGSLLLKAMEDHERATGVADWFGWAEGDDAKLRRCYERHGFEVRNLNEPKEFIIPGLPNIGLLQDDKKVQHEDFGFRKAFTENSW
ncbi:GNAT family N-acetyltransferase [Kocuria dechangensis]|uniref:GNAT family N-acetyltransferase n=1 Tax=Kocuria dechangensis TaxID=1176249 RepID=UPI00166F3040|nr:GNAT family N-acetyltransferase [Kocuria dechangensis]